jgi:hypothetical protein
MIEISNYTISMIHWSMLFQITVKSFKVLRWTISNFNTEPQGKYLRWTNLHIVDHGTLFEWMNSHSHHLLHFFLFWSDLVWLCFRKILLFLKGNKNKGVYLSIYLEAVKTANMSEGWSRDVKVKFVLFNKRNTNMTITKGGFYFPHNDLNILYMFRMWSSHFPFYATKFTLDTWFCQKPDMIWMQRRLTGTYSFFNVHFQISLFSFHL